VAVTLLGAVVLALCCASGFALPASGSPAHLHPAGCHSHRPASPFSSPSPTPAPANHQCCVSGHQAAMPNA